MAEYIVEVIQDQDGGMCDFGAVGPEIIRCRDCKHSGDYGWSCRKWRDGEYDEDVQPDGFCAWAERDAND